MKNKKRKAILIVCFVLVFGLFWLLDTDRYIMGNITAIDKVDSIQIVTKEKTESYPFDDTLIRLVSYSGFVIKIDNYFVEQFAPYRKKLTKTDMRIRYNSRGVTIATADVFLSNDYPNEYILYMNNVYWTTHSKFVDLVELAE